MLKKSQHHTNDTKPVLGHSRHYHQHTFIFAFENEPDLKTIFMWTISQVNSSVCLENNILCPREFELDPRGHLQ